MAVLLLTIGCEPSDVSPPAEPFDPFRLPPIVPTDPPAQPGLYYRDADGDRYAGREAVMADADPDGAGDEWLAVKTAEDCDDDPRTCGAGCYPNFLGGDLCDGWDQDCDGSFDEDPELIWFVDRDGDGAGDPLSGVPSCDPSDGSVAIGNDCDDDPNACGAACAPSKPEALISGNCSDGFDNDCNGTFDVDAAACDVNRPPIARFAVDPGGGSITDTFFFDARETQDPEDPLALLSFSWDFDSDGIFELRRNDPSATWTFASEGTHRITLRVEDPKGLFGEYVAHAVVSPQQQLIVVTSTADTIADDQQTTLREAITAANTSIGPDTIIFSGPLTITLATGPLPIITGADTTIAGRPGVLIRGSALALDFCLEADSARATLLWLDIGGCPEDGIEMHGTSHWVAYVRSHDNGDDGVDFSSGSGNRIGPHVEVWNNGDAGFELEGEMLVVEQSRTFSNARGLKFSSAIPAHRTVVVRNTIALNGIGMTVAPAVDEIALWQNTIYGNQGPGVRYDAPAAGATSGQLHDVRNNVFVANTGAAINTSGSFANLSANAFFDNASRCNGCDVPPQGIMSDPVLMDPGAGDYRLAPGSPCIDAGEDLGLGFKGNAPDLGAFEHDP